MKDRYTIVVEMVKPPIPDRGHDWRAYEDGHEDGQVEYGRTAWEALMYFAEEWLPPEAA